MKILRYTSFENTVVRGKFLSCGVSYFKNLIYLGTVINTIYVKSIYVINHVKEEEGEPPSSIMSGAICCILLTLLIPALSPKCIAKSSSNAREHNINI